LALVFVYLTVTMTLRGYIGNHLPLASGFETMQFMSWCTLLLAFLIQNKFGMASTFGALLSGLTLLVSMMGESNPQITQLMPVLSSPLLSIHVVVIMLSYSMLAFVMLNGITALVLNISKNNCELQIERLYIISRIMLYPSVFLLTIGIFVGAVWANISWGRYWGWDPKEVWALITMLVYATALHPNLVPWLKKPLLFHLFSILSFISVLITYFGVNFILGGMHAYAN
jgi:ABC-type transport system involved in cytochrome c biogenesis permease subunit